MFNKSAELVLIADLARLGQEQRFYMLRFFWVMIEALEQCGTSPQVIEELRGLYQGYADGVNFSDVVGRKKEPDDSSDPSPLVS
mgnify:CR=1 FL=1